MNKQTFLDIKERALLNIDKCPLNSFVSLSSPVPSTRPQSLRRLVRDY